MLRVSVRLVQARPNYYILAKKHPAVQQYIALIGIKCIVHTSHSRASSVLCGGPYRRSRITRKTNWSSVSLGPCCSWGTRWTTWTPRSLSSWKTVFSRKAKWTPLSLRTSQTRLSGLSSNTFLARFSRVTCEATSSLRTLR